MGGGDALETQIAEYRVIELLGRGGMGVVYLAEHTHLAKKVALKVLPPEYARDESFRERFEREARLAASLDHPNIVPVFDAGQHEGRLWIAMRFVQGTDLRSVLAAEGPLPAQRALSILGRVASALDAAHARGLVHRDVKPANIMLEPPSPTNPYEHVYLTDFGLTKRFEGESPAADVAKPLTRTGFFVGTVDYAPPEQFEGKHLDERADVYALACVLHELLTGRQPFSGRTDAAIMYAHLTEPPPKASQLRPGLPPAIDEVIARGMAKNPADRYASCGELIQAARRALTPAALTPATHGPAMPPPPAPVAPHTTTAAFAPSTAPTAAPAPPGRRGGLLRGFLPWIAGGGVLAAVVVGIVLVASGGGPEPGPSPATPPTTVSAPPSAPPTFRPAVDNRRILFTSGRQGNAELFTINEDRSGLTEITSNATAETFASWSPDFRRIVFVSDRAGIDGEIFVMNADGSNVRQLTNNAVDDLVPTFSPDGRRIAFASDLREPGNIDIYTMAVDGTDVRRLTNTRDVDSMPSFSPDGTRIAFSSRRDGNFEIYVMNVDGSGQTRLTTSPGEDSFPDFSPDSKRIAFDSERDGNFEIYVMEADGEKQTRLTNAKGADVVPSWSPDETRIAFSSDRDGDSDVYRMDETGENVFQLTNDPGVDFGPAWSGA